MSHSRSFPFLALGLAALALVPCSAAAGEAPPVSGTDAKRPNMVFIFSDDHALRTIGAYGSGLNKTPSIDRLADEGALFTRSYCTNSICCPSRATILTGKHSHKNGVTRNGSRWNGDQFVFTRALSKAGYRTAVIGKWHLRGWPTDEFDHWKLLSGGGGQGHYYNPEFRRMDGGTERIEGYSTDIITDQSIQWMARQHRAGRRFMMMCQFKSPHIHRIPPPRHMDICDGRTLPEPETLFDDYRNRSRYAEQCWMRLFGMEEHILNITPPAGKYDMNERRYQFLARMTESQRRAFHRSYDGDNEAYRRLRAAGQLEGRALDRYKYQRFLKDYLGCVAAIDDNVGRILAWLDEQGLSEDTVVVYSSDQGFFTGEHGWNDKRWMYEETLSMPLLMRWPGRIAPGTNISAMVQNIDYAPTFLDMAGVEIPGEVQGRSLLPLFGGKTPGDWRDAIYYHYYMDGAYNLPRFEGVRTDRYKLINYYFPEQAWELFDLEKDPQELRSVQDDPGYRKVRSALEGDLRRLRQQYDVTEPKTGTAPAGVRDGPPKKKPDSKAEGVTARQAGGQQSPDAPPTKPNFVLFFADDLGYGDVGYQGGDVPTPHIDAIARNGVVFTDGYVTCPVCGPSRAGLLTGRYQQSFGFWDNIGPYRRSKDVEPGIPVDQPILPERLKKLGYAAGLFGKTHDGDAEAMMAFNRWDEFYGFNNGASNFLGDMNRTHNPIFHNRKIVSSPYTARGISHDAVNRKGVLVRDTENYLTDVLGDRAARFIDANKDRPFLCYIPFNAVHGPFQAPKALVDKYADQPDEKRRRVMAMLDSMDRNVGKVMAALRRNNLEENTLIVFLSDNGGHDASPNRPLRGKKGTFWEGGLRVPFCMQWKGKIPAGRTYKRPVIALDLLPTFVAAAGGTIDPGWKLDGKDLMPFVTGRRSTPPHDCLHWAWGARKAIRQGDMKALSTDGGQTWRMFDLSRDTSEENDLAPNRPKILEALVQRQHAWEGGLMPPQWGWNPRLGYRDPGFGKPKPYHDPAYFDRPGAEDPQRKHAIQQLQARERPNVVLIYADDMGWGDVGYHGVDDIITPNIDRLASGGVRFSQGYVSASVCGPSRCGLMTGVYQQRLGCGENPNTRGFPQDPKFPFAGLPRSQPILSEMLKPLGYHCGMVGKWHLGLHETMRPNARGFDYFYGFLNGAHDYERALPRFGRNKGLWPLFRNNEMLPEYEGYLTDSFSDEAVGFIRRNRDQPFFLYVAYNAVHHPWQVPEKYLERTKHISDVKDRRFFAGMVLAMDDGVGRIVDALDEAGVGDNTLVLFISDNGTPRGQGLDHPRKDMRKERGGCTMSSAGPFRGFKGDTFEGGIRVPYVMRWPGKIKPGMCYDHPVTNLDVVPTVMAHLGVNQPPKGFAFDGVDLMPYLAGKMGDRRPHDVLFWRRDDDYAVRKGDWKLAWNDASCPAGSGAMLFNLAADPGEHKDLSGQHPERKQALQDLFDAWDCRLPPSPWWGGPKNRKPNPDAVVPEVPVVPKRSDNSRRTTLSAADAVLHGRTLRRNAEVISHWSDPAEWIEWTFTAGNSGAHRVILEYAAPHPSHVVVHMGDRALPAILPARRDWGDVGGRLLGEVDLKASQKYRLRLKPGQPWRAVNVRRILLEPAPPTIRTGRKDRPNIILIMADDLGAECIGAYGCRAYKTPVLDRLAAQGIRFENCHAQPLCTPSRVKIMTGRYAFRNYIGFGRFDMGEVTFGKVLQEAGYRTCMTGKWQLGGDCTTPIAMGFDEYCLQNAIAPAEPFDRRSRGRERYWGYPPIVANGRLYKSEQRYGPDMISEYAINFIKRQAGGDAPFFLYYPMILPHSPFVPSPLSADGDKSGAKVSELKYFKDMVEYIDVLVGRVVKALEETGQRENTVIMFTGDNGTTYPVKVTAPAPEGHPKVAGIQGARHASQLPPGVEPAPRDGLWEGPLTRTNDGDVPGGKDLMSHRGTHVPLIVDWPRHRSAHGSLGNACDDLIDFSDFFATLADLAEAGLPEDRVMDGISFAPRLKGLGAGARKYIFCHYWEFGRKKENVREFVQDARWKLYNDGRFYDLNADLEERSPLADLDAAASQARRRLQGALEEVRSAR